MTAGQEREQDKEGCVEQTAMERERGHRLKKTQTATVSKKKTDRALSNEV